MGISARWIPLTLAALLLFSTGSANESADYYKKEQARLVQISRLLKLIETQKSSGDFSGLKESCSELADCYRQERDCLSALHYCFAALEYAQKLPDERRGPIYLDIAEIFRILNRTRLARKYLQSAMDDASRHRDDHLMAAVQRVYSRLAYEEGDYEAALRFIDKSIGLERKSGENEQVCEYYYRKALVLEELGRSVEALTLLEAAVKTGLAGRNYQNVLPILAEYIERLIEAGRFSQAADHLARLDDIYAPYYPYYFLYYYLKARLYERRGNATAALGWYRKALKRLADYFSKLKDHRYGAFKKKIGEIYARATGFYLEMYRQTGHKIYFKKALFYSEVQNSWLYELVSLGSQRYARFQEEKEKLAKELVKKTQGAGAEALEKQYEELNEFMLEMPIRYRNHRFKDFDLLAIQGKLSPRQLIIKYCLLEDDVYVLFMDRSSLGFKKIGLGSREIFEEIDRLTEPLDDFTRGEVDYLRIHYNLELAHRLYKILLEDILKQHRTKNEIFVIPDKVLFKLPFEALVTGFNRGKMEQGVIFSEYRLADYLVEKYVVSYCFSLFHLQKRFAQRGKKKYLITAFGHPLIENGAMNGPNIRAGDLIWFHDIPSAKEELLDIGALFGHDACRLFLGEEFVKANFSLYAPQSRIVHLASHFINNRHHPQYSALLFSPHKGINPFYYAHEIFNLKLNSDLVVLSACESSEKHLHGIQGMRGMTASFRHAGVRSMMVSMWPVDELSSQLLTEFYREYKTHLDRGTSNRPGSVTGALRQAKLNLMKRTSTLNGSLRISFAHPFLWANFILYNFYK